MQGQITPPGEPPQGAMYPETSVGCWRGKARTLKGYCL